MEYINENMKNYIIRSLDEKWDKNSHYFYPLDSSHRDDLIALDKEYVDNEIKIRMIIEYLIEHGVNSIYELREDGVIVNKQLSISETLWRSDDYFWVNEGYWFDDQFDWIIYSSHEGILTFGGEWLISKIKYEWSDWNTQFKWDSKN